MVYCEICKKTCKTLSALGCHLTRKHPEISSEEYYNKFLRIDDNDGVCCICGNPTVFLNLAGYKKTCSKKCGIEKAKQSCEKTFMERYGVRSPMQNKEMKEKIRKTNQQKYNCNFYTQSPEFKNKSLKTKISRYGDENYNNRDKAKNSMLNRYGAPTSLESSTLREQIVKTCKKRYGCENPMQNCDIQQKVHRKIKYENKTFDSSWELIYYIYLKSKNIDFIFHPKKKFKYFYNNKVHYYFPDFKVNNDYVEIKGLHFFEDDRMINPYDRTQDDFYMAKLQCMKDNNIIIKTNCEEEKEYINEIFGRNFIKEILK